MLSVTGFPGSPRLTQQAPPQDYCPWKSEEIITLGVADDSALKERM